MIQALADKPIKTSPRFAVDLPMEQLRVFCDKWRLTEMALFGPVLGEAMRPNDRIEVLISMARGTQRGAFEFGEMQEELGDLFGRPVLLLGRNGLKYDPDLARVREIRRSATVIYQRGQAPVGPAEDAGE